MIPLLLLFIQVTIDVTEPPDSSAGLDVVIKMYPLKKQDISVTADASYNTQDVIAGGNLFLNAALADAKNSMALSCRRSWESSR